MTKNTVDKLVGLGIVISIVVAIVLLAKWEKVETQALTAVLGALAASAANLLRSKNESTPPGPGAAGGLALVGGVIGAMFGG